MRAFQSHLDRLVCDASLTKLFPRPPIFEFVPEKISCCSSALQVLKTTKRTAATLAIGECICHETVLQCRCCKQVYEPEQLRCLVPDKGKFGFDVIVYIGTALFLESKTESAIQSDLAARNITISRREIGHLGQRFIMYLALAHKDSGTSIRSLLSKKGGYILHLDGTCEGDSPHLMTTMDELSGLVLNNVKLPSEKAAHIVPLLKDIQANYGDPRALVHDMGVGILDAIKQVFPGTPDYICHYHFLRDIGKDLFEAKYTILRNTLKSYGLKTGVRNFVKKLHVKINRNVALQKRLAVCITSGSAGERNNRPPIINAYLLGLWLLDYTSELSGFGFPFDRPHLAFFDRLKTAYTTAKEIDKSIADNWAFAELQDLLNDIVHDDTLHRHVEDMREKIAVFEELRKIMRIASPANSNGLNDDGTNADLKSMEAELTEFRKQLVLKQATTKVPDITYKKMIRQIDKYWRKLFAAAITVQTPDGPITIQPQRTNNILERFFRRLKRMFRKKSGATILTKTLRHMLADTPLVMNLNNPDYLKAILNGADSLAARFAQIEVSRIRQMAMNHRDEIQTTPMALKKLIRVPDFIPTIGNQLKLPDTQSGKRLPQLAAGKKAGAQVRL